MNTVTSRLTLWLTMLFLTGMTWSQTVLAEPIESPELLLERTSAQVIKILRDDAEMLQKEPDRIYKIVDDYILPHLDDVTMAKLALGKSWRIATNEQKREFVASFRNLLVRTYSKSLLEFKDQKIKFFPANLTEDTDKTSVRAEIIQPGGPSIPMVYRVRITNNVWKVYDIKIYGVSLVTSYRGTFEQEIRKSGMGGLLKYLHDKNGTLAANEKV